MSVTAEEIVKLFEKDKKSTKKLSELLMTDPEIRLSIINSIIRDVATKDYVDNKFQELKNYIDEKINDVSENINQRINDVSENINQRINDVSENINQRISDVYGIVKASLVAIVVTLASTILTPLLLRIFFG